MEEQKSFELEQKNKFDTGKKNLINFPSIFRALVLNWKWFLLSLIISLGIALIYLRYITPYYQAHAKLMIRTDENGGGGRRGGNQQGIATFGMISNATNIDNEMELLRTRTLATNVVRDLKLYTSYKTKGKVKDVLVYKSQPITVDVDSFNMERLNVPIELEISREDNAYKVEGTVFSYDINGNPMKIEKTFTNLPMSINTKVGIITFESNGPVLRKGETEIVNILPLRTAGRIYAASLGVAQMSKSTSIANLSLTNEIPQRAVDFLTQLVECYNRQANEDKNEVAMRTEEFINSRLEKINTELGSTEGAIESYKRQKGILEAGQKGAAAAGQQLGIEDKIAESTLQLAILGEVQDYMNQPENRYQTMPSNVGLQDGNANALISEYNKLVLERNRMLQSASEENPSVQKITAQIDLIQNNIRRAMNQSRRTMEMRRNAMQAQYGFYGSRIAESPEQERILTQIGRQQEVKSSLYIMLLQKREENSISLAATARKGKLLDEPTYGGQVSPNRHAILTFALILGLSIPAAIILLLNFFRYKIEGHDDVVRLTNLPILADVAVANESAKTKAGIVVHENQNNQMEEIFRALRTNIQFMLKENEKVVMFTSSTAGEGKTFNASNIAVSFALLGKKVLLVGLDIRKPRLAELFEIDDHEHGITTLLKHDNPTISDLKSQIINSGINNNLDLLLAGPTPPNPTEMIARHSLEIIFDSLRDLYDYIIVDTAPVGLVTDTLQIARVADATVYLCRADYTPKTSFHLINGLAFEGKLPNVAVVINGIDMSKKKYGYYYGYGRYGKYGKYGKYGTYGYGSYGSYGYGYGSYGVYGNYTNSHYGDANDTSVKR